MARQVTNPSFVAQSWLPFSIERFKHYRAPRPFGSGGNGEHPQGIHDGSLAPTITGREHEQVSFQRSSGLLPIRLLGAGSPSAA
jgi:hypothetical protein